VTSTGQHEYIIMCKSGRVIIDRPLAGAVNMAVDEALMLAAGQSGRVALRFYRWQEPTISLGYFQAYQEEYCQVDQQLRKLSLVRRTTGGGAILHDAEITYSLIVPVGHRLSKLAVVQLYRLVHGAFMEVLGGLGMAVSLRGSSNSEHGIYRGPFFCFAREHQTDVICDSQKLIGSAQRRTKRGILQHGSIILQRRYVQQPCVGLEDLCGKGVSQNQLLQRFADAISGALDVRLQADTLTEYEQQLVSILTEKYGSKQWTVERQWVDARSKKV